MHYLVKDLWVWCFTDSYPARIEVDCSGISPRVPIRIGDVEKMLPLGMYLHKKYETQKWTAIAKLQTTNSYVKRKNLIIEQNDQIMTQRRNM